MFIQRERIAEDVDEADARRDHLEVRRQAFGAVDLAHGLAFGPLAHLGVLDHEDLPAPPDGPQRHPERRRGLALAIAIEDQGLPSNMPPRSFAHARRIWREITRRWISEVPS